MNMKHLFVPCALMSLILTGCGGGSGDEPSVIPEPKPEPEKIPITISTAISRATDTAFEDGDRVGLFVVNYSGSTPDKLLTHGNYIDNHLFSFKGSWTPVSPVYWKDNATKADFYCYYPYVSSISDVNACPFSVKSNQSSVSDYKAGDFLWGKTSGVSPSASPVNILVKHLMSSLRIRLQASTGFTDSDLALANVSVCGIKCNASVNLEDGTISASGATSEILTCKNNGTYNVIVPPQSVSGTGLIKVVVNGTEYISDKTLNMESGKRYECTVTLERIGHGININISDWDSVDVDFGGIVE